MKKILTGLLIFLKGLFAFIGLLVLLYSASVIFENFYPSIKLSIIGLTSLLFITILTVISPSGKKLHYPISWQKCFFLTSAFSSFIYFITLLLKNPHQLILKALSLLGITLPLLVFFLCIKFYTEIIKEQKGIVKTNSKSKEQKKDPFDISNWKSLGITILFTLVIIGILYSLQGKKEFIKALEILALIIFGFGIFFTLLFVVSKETFLFILGQWPEYDKIRKATESGSTELINKAIDKINLDLEKEDKEKLKENAPTIARMFLMRPINLFIQRFFVGAFVAAFGLLGTITLLKQNDLFSTQNTYVAAQTDLIDTQNGLFKSQNDLFEEQNLKVTAQTDLLESQNNLFEEQNLKVTAQTDLLAGQNKLLESQNGLFKKQNTKIDEQTELFKEQSKQTEIQTSLIEADRRSALIFLMSNIMDKVDVELKEDKNKAGIRDLSPELIGRIAALSYSLKPYRFLDGDTLSKPLSPERAQLLIALGNLSLDSLNLLELHEKCIFEQSYLINANLIGADLRGAKMRNSVLKDADLTDAKIDNVDLSNCEITNIKFIGTSMNNTNLDGTDLIMPDFTKADLKNTNFKNANLSGAHLPQADLRGADLSGADLTGAYMPEAKLSSALFSEMTQLNSATLYNSKMDSIDLRGVSLIDAMLGKASINGGKLQGSIFKGAVLEDAMLKGADLEGADLSGAFLTLADLTRANLNGADIRNVELQETILVNVSLERARVKSINWIDLLDSYNVKGREKIAQEYYVEQIGKDSFQLVKKK